MKKNYKGIILAGGKGTRLSPLTKVVSKQLLPIYDKPMIYYPIETLVRSGIEEILIITTPEDKDIFEDLIGDGSIFNCKITFTTQEKPEGIAQAFLIAENWLSDSPSVLILGDNIFLKGNISNLIRKSLTKNNGATIFAYSVDDPSRYGVVNLGSNDEVLAIEEKPQKPKSTWAVTGLYIYNNLATKEVKNLKPSKRGELEITDLNNIFLKKYQMDVVFLPKNSYWLDAGTINSLLEAGNLVKKLKDKGNIY